MPLYCKAVCGEIEAEVFGTAPQKAINSFLADRFISLITFYMPFVYNILVFSSILSSSSFIIIEFLKTDGSVRRIRLEITPENEKAKRLYISEGFSPCEYKQLIFDK